MGAVGGVKEGDGLFIYRYSRMRHGDYIIMYVCSRVRGVEKMGLACSGGFALWQLPGMRGEGEGVGNSGCNEGMWVRSEV